MPRKVSAVFQDYRDALGRFDAVLQEAETEITRDAAIKRFELVFDLAWKLLQALLREHHGLRVPTGAYIYRMRAGEFMESKVMMLLK